MAVAVVVVVTVVVVVVVGAVVVVVVVDDVQQQGLGLDGLLNQLLLKKGRIYRSSRFQFPTL